MIASLVFDDDGTRVVLFLNDDGKWDGPAPWKMGLNILAKSVNTSPSLGRPYYAHAKEIAKILGANIEFVMKDDLPPDTVF